MSLHLDTSKCFSVYYKEVKMTMCDYHYSEILENTARCLDMGVSFPQISSLSTVKLSCEAWSTKDTQA